MSKRINSEEKMSKEKLKDTNVEFLEHYRSIEVPKFITKINSQFKQYAMEKNSFEEMRPYYQIYDTYSLSNYVYRVHDSLTHALGLSGTFNIKVDCCDVNSNNGILKKIYEKGPTDQLLLEFNLINILRIARSTNPQVREIIKGPGMFMVAKPFKDKGVYTISDYYEDLVNTVFAVYRKGSLTSETILALAAIEEEV